MEVDCLSLAIKTSPDPLSLDAQSVIIQRGFLAVLSVCHYLYVVVNPWQTIPAQSPDPLFLVSIRKKKYCVDTGQPVLHKYLIKRDILYYFSHQKTYFLIGWT